MLSVPSNMQPTLTAWKQNHTLGEGMRFTQSGSGSSYAELMDQVQLMDNQPGKDLNPEKGVVVCADDQETHRFTGDSQTGTLEAVTADGRVIGLNFTPESVDHLQLSPQNGGVEAIAQHFDRTGGDGGWMQVGGAVTVINMDEPGALDQIFGLGAPAPAQGAAVGAALASKLGVPADEVSVSSYDPKKGFNASNCGFAVDGELQMSAWTEGIEARLTAGGVEYTYRGLDESTGRYGQGESASGYWQLDERGIYVPAEAPKNDFGW